MSSECRNKKSPQTSDREYPWRGEMNSGGAPMLKKEDWMEIKAQLEKGFYQKDIANRLGVIKYETLNLELSDAVITALKTRPF
jgi:hypothetical protein